MKFSNTLLLTAAIVLGLSAQATAKDYAGVHNKKVCNDTIAKQRQSLEANTNGKGFGPQSPRDLNSVMGVNALKFTKAPSYQNMNLCNIHFHESAEHRGGEFTTYVGNGNGKGIGTGYKYSGKLSLKDVQPMKKGICPSKKGSLSSGDTIEVHYVHSTATVKPGPTLGACLSENNKNPQFRVETQVFVLSSDKNAADFRELTKLGVKNGYQQALNLPKNTGKPITYAGSTTGPSYNEVASPFQVTWNVRPKVMKVNIDSVGEWCKGNVFNEDHAHAVRNLVINPKLLSKIE